MEKLKYPAIAAKITSMGVCVRWLMKLVLFSERNDANRNFLNQIVNNTTKIEKDAKASAGERPTPRRHQGTDRQARTAPMIQKTVLSLVLSWRLELFLSKPCDSWLGMGSSEESDANTRPASAYITRKIIFSDNFENPCFEIPVSVCLLNDNIIDANG